MYSVQLPIFINYGAHQDYFVAWITREKCDREFYQMGGDDFFLMQSGKTMSEAREKLLNYMHLGFFESPEKFISFLEKKPKRYHTIVLSESKLKKIIKKIWGRF